MSLLVSSAAKEPVPEQGIGGYRFLKRSLDITAAILGLAALVPLFLLVALAIKLDNPGPVLFRQVRVGRGGRHFQINKFRTMSVGAAWGGAPLTVGNDPRITRLGAVLRRHKIDELPQLLNVLLGDMSLVGPRPEVPELLAQYSASTAAAILSVKPGLTDDASILFRDESTMLGNVADPDAFYREVILPSKHVYHTRYLANACLSEDLRVIAATLSLLILKRVPRALDRRAPVTRLRGPECPALSPAGGAASSSTRQVEPIRQSRFHAANQRGPSMSIHVLVMGGEDHDLRLPFMVQLQDRGFRVTAAGSGSPLPFERADIPYRRFHFERFVDPVADWRALSTIRALVSDVRPDVVQCFDTKLNILVPIALRNCARSPAVVRTINGRGWLYSSRSPSALLFRLIYRVLHRAASRSTRVEIFEHAEDRAFFEAGGMVGKGGALVVPGAGIDVPGFESSRAGGLAPEVLRAQLGLGHAPVVMTVTRLTRQKGIGTLLAAAADVHRTHPDVRFVLVGPRDSEGPLAIAEAEITRHAPYVLATGPRADVPSLLGLADLFVFPTEYREGIPRALCEAALAEVPIVTTDMPGCQQVIRDGWNGLVVPAGAQAQLAAGIRHMLDDRDTARAMALNGVDSVRKVFSLSAIVAGYAAIYRRATVTPFGTRMSDTFAEAIP